MQSSTKSRAQNWACGRPYVIAFPRRRMYTILVHRSKCTVVHQVEGRKVVTSHLLELLEKGPILTTDAHTVIFGTHPAPRPPTQPRPQPQPTQSSLPNHNKGIRHAFLELLPSCPLSLTVNVGCGLAGLSAETRNWDWWKSTDLLPCSASENFRGIAIKWKTPSSSGPSRYCCIYPSVISFLRLCCSFFFFFMLVCWWWKKTSNFWNGTFYDSPSVLKEHFLSHNTKQFLVHWVAYVLLCLLWLNNGSMNFFSRFEGWRVNAALLKWTTRFLATRYSAPLLSPKHILTELAFANCCPCPLFLPPFYPCNFLGL